MGDDERLGLRIWPAAHYLWVIILMAIVALAVWLVRSLTRQGAYHHLPTRRSAGLEFLEERYARGEIKREEYLEKKRDILA